MNQTLIAGRFIAVWFTKANDLYSKAEVIWEGKDNHFLLDVFLSYSRKAVFELIAAIMIFVMGLSMLKLDRGRYNFEVNFYIQMTLHFIAKTKWRIKLQKAFEGKSKQHVYLK